MNGWTQAIKGALTPCSHRIGNGMSLFISGKNLFYGLTYPLYFLSRAYRTTIKSPGCPPWLAENIGVGGSSNNGEYNFMHCWHGYQNPMPYKICS